MYIPLTEAPKNTQLKLDRLLKPNLKDRLSRMGFTKGTVFRLMDEEIMLQPVRARGANEEVVIPAGMAGKIVVHLNDGRKLPLAEMKTGDHGHIEGRTGGKGLQRSLELLGFGVNSPIRFLRKLPFMEYVAMIQEESKRVTLPESIAAKILGLSQNNTLQLCVAPTGKAFRVTDILGGKAVQKTMNTFGIEPGKILVPKEVKQGNILFLGKRKAEYVIATSQGLRLFLEEYQARSILVRTITEE